jgi:hypothetical protein
MTHNNKRERVEVDFLNIKDVKEEEDDHLTERSRPSHQVQGKRLDVTDKMLKMLLR